MTTTTHQVIGSEKAIQARRGSGHKGEGITPSGSQPRAVMNAYSPHPASSAIYVAFAAIAMTFAALTSAMVVRKGGAIDWNHFSLPPILYVNTGVIFSSSIALEAGRRAISRFMTNRNSLSGSPIRWLYLTSFLGVLFVSGQYLAWLQLRREGLYLPTTPSSSFFYVFTVAHALHVIGGLVGLALVIHRLVHLTLRKSTLDVVSRYWHFVDLLWIYLLCLLWANI